MSNVSTLRLVCCPFPIVCLENEERDLRNDLSNELLPRWLASLEQAKTSQELALVAGVGLELGLLVRVDEQDAQVAAAAALAGLEQGLGDIVQDVNGGGPVGGLGIARGHHPGLLLRLVELALANARLQPGNDLFDLVGFCGCHGGGERMTERERAIGMLRCRVSKGVAKGGIDDARRLAAGNERVALEWTLIETRWATLAVNGGELLEVRSANLRLRLVGFVRWDVDTAESPLLSRLIASTEGSFAVSETCLVLLRHSV